jgi:two-component system phosphate regulon sensor histidine kinase PhoR
MAGFVLAGLVGTAGVLLFFFVTYRQRVRIRELSRLEKFRRDFISDVSHEIKTPLTGIIGAVDILDEGEALPLEDRAGALAMIRRESLRLNALVQNILTLSRLEHYNENGFEFADADLAEIAEDSVRRFENRAKARGVKLILTVNSTCVDKCDAAQISRALDNLINNAIVHSSATEVKVQLSQSHKYGLLAVQDNGRGIPLEHQARIFDRFYRVDSSRGQETGGAGLGLSIVHAIASLHGGAVRFEALKPAGCSFTLQLPR